MEILAEGIYEGIRARVIADYEPYTADMMPDGDCYMPQFWINTDRWLSWELGGALGMDYMDMDVDDLLRGIQEIHDLARSQPDHKYRDNWEELGERWLRMIGFREASIRQVSLDQSSYGYMVAVMSDEWMESMGIRNSYPIEDTETLELENWLKGDVSYMQLQLATHDCDCEYCTVEWVTEDAVTGIYLSPWEIDDGMVEHHWTLTGEA